MTTSELATMMLGQLILGGIFIAPVIALILTGYGVRYLSRWIRARLTT
jgi:hypothetical protein